MVSKVDVVIIIWILACLYIHFVWQLLFLWWYDFPDWDQDKRPYNFVVTGWDMYGKIDLRYGEERLSSVSIVLCLCIVVVLCVICVCVCLCVCACMRVCVCVCVCE